MRHHEKNPLAWTVFADPMAEFRRQGIDEDEGSLFREYTGNKEYQISPTYPAVNVIPMAVTDEQMKEVGRFRSKGRFPSK